MESTFGASLQHKAPATVSSVFFVSSLFLQWMGVHTPLSHRNWHHNVVVCFQPILNTSAVQPPTLNESFVEEVKSTGISFSHDPEDRVFRAHGKTRTKFPRTSWYFIDKSLLFISRGCAEFVINMCFLPGHCLHEIFALREGKIGRVPDMVVWPSELKTSVGAKVI